MRKIETLFLRTHELAADAAAAAGMSATFTKSEAQLVTPFVRPGCEWVLAGHGYATEKFDGSACLVMNGKLFKRCELKPFNKLEGWIHWSFDPTQASGHGWLPVGEGPDDRWHREAWQRYWANPSSSSDWQIHQPLVDGTYELVGPKVQRNPYGLIEHQLWHHGSKLVGNGAFWDSFYAQGANQFALLKLLLSQFEIEGLVFYHEDDPQRMVKIKRRDFGIPWPLRTNRPKVSDAKLDAMLEGSEPK